MDKIPVLSVAWLVVLTDNLSAVLKVAWKVAQTDALTAARWVVGWADNSAASMADTMDTYSAGPMVVHLVEKKAVVMDDWLAALWVVVMDVMRVGPMVVHLVEKKVVVMDD